MSYPFTLPTAESIRVESRLRPEQVDVSFAGVSDLLADIEPRIPGAADVVMSKLRKCATPNLWPLPDGMIEIATQGETPADIEQTINEWLSLASQAVSKRAQAGLYFTAGQLKESYRANAIRLIEESNALLDTICAAVQWVKAAQPDAIAESQPAPRPRSVQRTVSTFI